MKLLRTNTKEEIVSFGGMIDKNNILS